MSSTFIYLFTLFTLFIFKICPCFSFILSFLYLKWIKKKPVILLLVCDMEKEENFAVSHTNFLSFFFWILPYNVTIFYYYYYYFSLSRLSLLIFSFILNLWSWHGAWRGTSLDYTWLWNIGFIIFLSITFFFKNYNFFFHISILLRCRRRI